MPTTVDNNFANQDVMFDNQNAYYQDSNYNNNNEYGQEQYNYDE